MGSCSTLRQGLPGERQEPPRPLSGPDRDQVFKPRRRGPGKRSLPGQEDEAPARGACRAKEARPRQEELAGTTEPKHQGPGGRSPPGRPNQGTPREARRGTPRAPARPDERQALRRRKTTTAASHLPRQVATSGPRSSSPAHASLWGSPKGTWRGTVRPEVCGGMQRPSWQTVVHLTVHLGAVRATETGI